MLSAKYFAYHKLKDFKRLKRIKNVLISYRGADFSFHPGAKTFHPGAKIIRSQPGVKCTCNPKKFHPGLKFRPGVKFTSLTCNVPLSYMKRD